MFSYVVKIDKYSPNISNVQSNDKYYVSYIQFIVFLYSICRMLHALNWAQKSYWPNIT